ncbi:hypothetical protein BS17DRAFT_791202, partial [Gyrodon lividus]
MLDGGTKQQAVNGRKAPQIDPRFSNSTILLFPITDSYPGTQVFVPKRGILSHSETSLPHPAQFRTPMTKS